MTLPAEKTLLTLTGMGIPLYSTRGATQTMTPIQESIQLERTVNGTLRDLSQSQFRKVSTKISCKDQQVPAFGGIYPGKQLVIGCCSELSYPVGFPDGRAQVGGSARTVSGFVFYLPSLTVLVTAWDYSFDEYNHEYNWNLSGEEV